jgi:4-amino-4-deoxy-L-arabinose transferase-like glycosyltransferase
MSTLPLKQRAAVRRELWTTGMSLVLAVALAELVIHLLTNGQYGFHRDELATLDDARHMDWGFVAYPPLTPAVAWLEMQVFGTTPFSIRLLSALTMSGVVVLAGVMARALGGGRQAQVVAALATAIAPIVMVMGALFQYVAFDYLWWTLVAYFAIRLINSGDARWWLAIGAAIGLGMMTKYTMGVWVLALVGGVLLTPQRRDLRSPWLWAGAGLAILIVLPNLIWQARHDFISLDFLAAIHARDVRIGRTSGYVPEQFIFSASLFTLPLWIGGLVHCFRPQGWPYRLLVWMYLFAFVILLALQGRSYYLGPAYPMLFAAGAVAWERWLAARPVHQARRWMRATWAALAMGVLASAALTLPIAPINSPLWDLTAEVHDLFTEEIGWDELTEQVAAVYTALPAEKRAQTGILAGNYGEAGALNLYGPTYGLPTAISAINSHWLRGYGDPPPQMVVVVGYQIEVAELIFRACELTAPVTNRYGVENEETRDYPGILVCREPRAPWPEIWPKMLHFG